MSMETLVPRGITEGMRRIVRLAAILNLAHFGIEFALAVAIWWMMEETFACRRGVCRVGGGYGLRLMSSRMSERTGEFWPITRPGSTGCGAISNQMRNQVIAGSGAKSRMSPRKL